MQIEKLKSTYRGQKRRHMKLLYWRSHGKKLRIDRRRDEKSGDESVQSRRESSPLPTKESLPQSSAIDRNPILTRPEPSRVSIETSALSGALASDLGSQFTIPTAEAKIPSPRRAGASTVLESTAKFPSPPQFEDGEVQKPCPLCQKITSSKLTILITYGGDLLPFVCISSSCLQSPTFASRSDWKAHTEREHGVFWRQGPSTPIGNDNQSLNPNFQDSFDVGRSADICPLCCLPLDKSRPKLKSIAVLSVSSGSQNLDEVLVTSPPGSKKDFEGTKEGAKTVRFDVPKSGSEEEPPRDPTARSVADLETRIVAPMKTPVMDSTMSLMMDHIADHLQFLALLTLRFHSAATKTLKKRTTLDDEMGTDEGYEVPEMDEDAFFDTIVLEEKSPDTASSKNE
ncbi:hypothetical protein N5P37_005472 [Trichoderma harzianum]|nr:hypothetical protein N5P37_005472 [Trichoderma harzianum]